MFTNSSSLSANADSSKGRRFHEGNTIYFIVYVIMCKHCVTPSIVRGVSESGKRSYTTSPRGTNILHYLVGRIKPEHFMMQNICMATESTSSFYRNEPNKMQNKNVGKTAAAQLHFSAKIENCSSSPPFCRHPRILCL